MRTDFSIRPVGAPATTAVAQPASNAVDAASPVCRVIDGETENVLGQYTDDATLHRRAYLHARNLTKRPPTRRLATDRKA